MRITGRKLITGPVAGTPSRSPNQPHWKTATTAPNEAATESRNPMAALTGTRIERNTSRSRISARPTTTRAKGSSAFPSRSETSMATAVWPGRQVAQVGHERVRRLLLRAALRNHRDDRRRAVGQQTRLGERDVVQPALELAGRARGRPPDGP